jgi:hypothetical protein
MASRTTARASRREGVRGGRENSALAATVTKALNSCQVLGNSVSRSHATSTRLGRE